MCPIVVYCQEKNLKTVDISCERKSIIKIIHLEDNLLGNLSGDIFKNLTNVRVLQLEGNKIDHVDKSVFDDLQNLQHLNLHHNRIKSVASTFQNLNKLQVLNIQRNRIKEIEANSFSSQKCLHTLSLEYNNITDINVDAFPENASLKFFTCNNNNISDVTFLKKLNQLTYLDISNNCICDILVDTFSNFTEMKNFIGKKNQITNVDFLGNLVNLQYLDLSSNQIHTVTNVIFNKLVNLEKLFLDHNEIESIAYGAFSELKQLTDLDLGYNKIRSFGEVLSSLNNIQVLGLNDNCLETIVITKTPNVTLHIDNNNWRCAFVEELFKVENITLNYTYNHSVEHYLGVPCTHHKTVITTAKPVDKKIENNNPSQNQVRNVVLMSMFFILIVTGMVIYICILRKRQQTDPTIHKEKFEMEEFTCNKNLRHKDGEGSGYLTPMESNIYEEIE